MAEWTRTQDRELLLRAAECAISAAFRDGDRGGEHSPGSWMAETVHEQFRHIEIHIAQYQIGDRAADHLAHIVCRAVIAATLPGVGRLKEEITGNPLLISPWSGGEQPTEADSYEPRAHRVEADRVADSSKPPPDQGEGRVGAACATSGSEDIDTINRIIKKLGEVIETYPPESKESIALWGFREWLEAL
jgi:hypothetical protein